MRNIPLFCAGERKQSDRFSLVPIAPPAAETAQMLLGMRQQAARQRSSGVNPVRLAIRASMRGPISSPSWKAKTKSGQPSRERMRCEVPRWRLTTHPIASKAERTRRDLRDGQRLTREQEMCPRDRARSHPLLYGPRECEAREIRHDQPLLSGWPHTRDTPATREFPRSTGHRLPGQSPHQISCGHTTPAIRENNRKEANQEQSASDRTAAGFEWKGSIGDPIKADTKGFWPERKAVS